MNRYLILPFALSIPYIANAQNEKMRENVLNPVIITGTGTYHKAENCIIIKNIRYNTSYSTNFLI